MSCNILWQRNYDEALSWARSENKPLFIDWSDLPACLGCVSLENTTYPDREISAYINEHFVPVQLNQEEVPGVFNKNRIVWTPTVTVFSVNGEEQDRWSGYLPPQEFLPRVKFARASSALFSGDYKTTIECFDDVAANHPDSFAAADALYWLGVGKWKKDRSFEALRECWKSLSEKYPQSQAAAKASYLF